MGRMVRSRAGRAVAVLGDPIGVADDLKGQTPLGFLCLNKGSVKPHDQIIKECVKELGFDEKKVHPKGVREEIQRSKDYLLTPFQYSEKAEDIYQDSVGKVYKFYEEKMKKSMCSRYLVFQASLSQALVKTQVWRSLS